MQSTLLPEPVLVVTIPPKGLPWPGPGYSTRRSLLGSPVAQSTGCAGTATRSSLQHQAGAVPGCWQWCHHAAWAEWSQASTFIPGTNPALPSLNSRENPGAALGTERDSNRAHRKLVNPCMALKFGVVFFLESSARGQQELWRHLGFPRTSSPQSQHVPRDTLCPAGEGRKHLPGTMLSSLEADPTSMVFWWNCCGVRHHMRLTGVRDASFRTRSAKMSAARSALLIPSQPGTQACLGHPAAHRHSQCPRFQPGPGAAPQVPGAGQPPQTTSSPARTQGLDYPVTFHSTHLHLVPQAPTFLLVSPYPQGCTSPESTSAAPCRAGKSWGA